MSTALARIPMPTTQDEMMQVSDLFAKSGLFKDVQGMAQCFVKVCAGREIGMPPFASMNGIHIISGKTTLGGGIIAAAIKRSGRYNYRLLQNDDKACIVSIREKVGDSWEECGQTPWTVEMAKRAGLLGNATWTKYPEAMLFNRAIAAAARAHCPDIFGGPVYTPEELGAVVDEDGNFVSHPEIKPAAPLRVVSAETVTEAQPDPFREHIVKMTVAAFKEAKLTPTLVNVAECLHMSAMDVEKQFWNSKNRFTPDRCSDEELFRLAHFAKSGNVLAEDAPVADAMRQLREQLEEVAENAG